MDNLVLFLWESGKVFMALLLFASACSVFMNVYTIGKLDERVEELERKLHSLSLAKLKRKYQRRKGPAWLVNPGPETLEAPSSSK